MKALPYVLAGCIGGLVSGANAQSLMINASAVGGLQHSHYPYLVSTDLQTFTAPTPAVSLRDYNAMAMTFSAPAGYAWQTHCADYATQFNNNLHCEFAYGTKPADAAARRVDYYFDFVPGMESTVHYSGEGWGTGWVSATGFGFDGGFNFGGDVAFTSLTVITYAAPTAYAPPLDSFVMASLRFEMLGAPVADPGPHTFLMPVPEPGAGALMGLAGVLWIGKRSIG